MQNGPRPRDLIFVWDWRPSILRTQPLRRLATLLIARLQLGRRAAG
jgi:hypothetical protein